MPKITKTPKIAFTLGDMNGIGAEVTLKTLVTQKYLNSLHPILIGPESIWKQTAKKYKLNLKFSPYNFEDSHKKGVVSILNIEPLEEISYGKVSAKSGALSIHSIELAYKLIKQNFADAMVTAPICKEAINLANFHYDGHTSYLASISKNKNICMMLINDIMRVGLVTTHLPISDVSKNITQSIILKKIMILNKCLQIDFNIKRPSIAVLSLNPHAGDGGILGKEETKIIIPAIKKAKIEKINIDGPFPSDSFFARYKPNSYDAILSMYHDQGLIPLKMTDNNRGVNLTAGLEFIRTSPDHGTAFDIAGKGKADPSSSMAATELSIKLIQLKKKR
jgi:4-hydroxythreonine-4-phosphate dehydrogenase